MPVIVFSLFFIGIETNIGTKKLVPIIFYLLNVEGYILWNLYPLVIDHNLHCATFKAG